MTFGLAVLGGGSAGFAAAIRAVELGARVVMVQDGTLGGTCVNVGCVPSKTLIRAAEARHRQSHHSFDGIARQEASVDWDAVRAERTIWFPRSERLSTRTCSPLSRRSR